MGCVVFELNQYQVSLPCNSVHHRHSIPVSIIFVVIDNPPAFFLASAVLICIGCLSILLPVFVPKFKLRHYINQPQGRNSAAIAIRSVTKSRIDRSSIKMPSNNSLTNHSLSTHGYSIHRNSSSSLPSAFARSTINPGSGHQGPRHSRQSSDLPTYGAHRVKRTHMRQSSPPYAGRVTFVVPASASPPLRTHVEDKPQQQQEEEGSSSLGSGSSFQ